MSWLVLTSFFLLLILPGIFFVDSIMPDGRYGVERPIGEKDTIRDSYYSKVRESRGADVLFILGSLMLYLFAILAVFFPLKRIVDFISVGFEQKRNGFEPSYHTL